MDRIIRKAELLRITGLSAASIYRLMAKGRFPQPVKLGDNSVGWFSSSVQEWLDGLRPKDGPDANHE